MSSKKAKKRVWTREEETHLLELYGKNKRRLNKSFLRRAGKFFGRSEQGIYSKIYSLDHERGGRKKEGRPKEERAGRQKEGARESRAPPNPYIPNMMGNIYPSFNREEKEEGQNRADDAEPGLDVEDDALKPSKKNYINIIDVEEDAEPVLESRKSILSRIQSIEAIYTDKKSHYYKTLMDSEIKKYIKTKK